MYVPPELICADEAVSGKGRRRIGLEWTKQILSARHATVLLVYKASRLSRNSSQGFQFIQEEVVEAGLRAVSVSEQIDTNERDRWKFALKTNVRGVFRPQLLRAIEETAELSVSNQPAGEEVAVWLRPPRLDVLAERVHQLMDQDGLSYRDTATQRQREGHNVNSGNVWYSYRRWYEMNGLPVPKRPYNNGQRRKSA